MQTYKDFRFGDIIENQHADFKGGRRFGYFVQAKDKGRGNRREKVVVLTDGYGQFWEVVIGGSRLHKMQGGDLPLLHEPSLMDARHA